MHIQAADTRAVVIDRRLLNNSLLEMGQEGGVEFSPHSRVVGLEDQATIIERDGDTYRGWGRILTGCCPNPSLFGD